MLKPAAVPPSVVKVTATDWLPMFTALTSPVGDTLLVTEPLVVVA